MEGLRPPCGYISSLSQQSVPLGFVSRKGMCEHLEPFTQYKALTWLIGKFQKQTPQCAGLQAAIECILVPIVLDEQNLPNSWFGVRISNEQQILLSFPPKKRQSFSKKFIPWWPIKIELQFMLWSTPSVFRLLRCIFHGNGWFRWIPGALHHCWWH